jgi:phosphate transport system permease protein
VASTTNAMPSGGPARPAPRDVQLNRTFGDRLFRAIATAGGLTTLVLLVLIGLFLLLQAWPALREAGLSFFTTQEWQFNAAGTNNFGVAALVYWTVVIAVIALVIAVPVAIACALFVTEYAPKKLRGPLTSLIDLLAAVPSLIFGIWGFFFLQPRLLGISEWLSVHFGWIPIFHVETPIFGSSAFVAGILLSLMVMPICMAVMRQVFSQAPPGEREAALALGSTRWGMIKAVVLPFGKGGIIGGSMLGLGRALGETVAVAIIISPIFQIRPNILQAGANSLAATIFLEFKEAPPGSILLSGLMAAGVTLFALTLVVNTIAAFVVSRSRSGQGVEI